MTNHEPTASELLRCENIAKRFCGMEVLSGISFSVSSGEILGIIGPNGAGKTTLMEVLAGLLPRDSGTLFWQNRPLAALESQKSLFYLPDGILPYADDRVENVLRFFQGIYAAENERFELLIDRLGLGNVLKKTVQSLSKGYRRRLLLAIGLLSPQPLLMLDEPFDGFDLRQTLGIMALLREALAERALLLSIHQLSEAEKICDRYILLSEGALVAEGTMGELRQQAGLQDGGLEEVFLALV